MLLVVLMTIVGSLCDVYTKKDNQSDLGELFKHVNNYTRTSAVYYKHEFFLCFIVSFFITFSFPANTKRLFLASNKTENLSCIDILKTHACVLVIIGQRMLYTAGQPLQNPKNVEEVSNVYFKQISPI